MPRPPFRCAYKLLVPLVPLVPLCRCAAGAAGAAGAACAAGAAGIAGRAFCSSHESQKTGSFMEIVSKSRSSIRVILFTRVHKTSGLMRVLSPHGGQFN